MHITQLRQADLNLLVVFTVMAEERNVSRAAKRLGLSQPALTRALQRLRQTFNDDLIIRVSGNYEPTPKGTRLLKELETMLPKLDRLLAEPAFDPAVEEARFRLTGTDYAAHVVCPPLCQRLLAAGKRVSFDFVPLGDHVFDSMERGRLDLLLHADDGHVPTQYPREVIFEEEFVCVVARESPFAAHLTTKQYLSGWHIGVAIFDGKQTIPEQHLKAAVMQRRCAFYVPFFSIAMQSVAGTRLIATVPRRQAEYEARNPALKILKAPKLMRAYKYLMTWHPRMNNDAAHIWLRSMVQQVGQSVTH